MGRQPMSVLRAALRASFVALVVAWSVGALYLVLVAVLWCIEGACNGLQGADPDLGYSVFLVALGLVAPAAGVCAGWVLRRRGWSRRDAWLVAASWGGAVAVPVLFVRAWL